MDLELTEVLIHDQSSSRLVLNQKSTTSLSGDGIQLDAT